MSTYAHLAQTPPAAATESTTSKPVTLADVLAAVADKPDLRSALRTIGRALKLPLELISAEPRQLRYRLGLVSPASIGIGKGRWQNIRFLLGKALRRAGIKALPGRARAQLAPEWERLRALLPDRHAKLALSRFMSWCTERMLPPETVDAALFEEFRNCTIEQSLRSRDPNGAFRDACSAWNHASRTISNWPRVEVVAPDRRNRFAYPIEAFPRDFQDDVETFLAQSADTDIFSDGYCRPVRPITGRGRRQRLLMAATALAKAGVPSEEITSLRVLVEPNNAVRLLRVLHERNDSQATGYIHQIAVLLKTIGRHYVGLDPASVDRLKSLASRLSPGRSGLTVKNKQCLRQFADPATLLRLLLLPDRIARRLRRKNKPGRRAAAEMALAVAIAIELAVPIRCRNLCDLRLDRHVSRYGEKTILHLEWGETKNGTPVQAELPPFVSTLLEEFVTTYRPLLATGDSPWLFPGEEGGRRQQGGFGSQISTFIWRETGIRITTHQFRHLAAKLFLDAHPRDYSRVAKLLGHKDARTTERFYYELDAVLSFRVYASLIEEWMAQATTTLKRRRRP